MQGACRLAAVAAGLAESLLDQIMENAENEIYKDETGFTLNGSVIQVLQVRSAQAAPLFFGRTLASVANFEIDVVTHRQYC